MGLTTETGRKNLGNGTVYYLDQQSPSISSLLD